MRRRPGLWGRRRPGRRLPGTRRRATVPPQVRLALQRARRMVESGRSDEAAAIYERLADRAYEDDRLRAAVQMDLEATRAWLQAAQLVGAQKRALHALDALLDRGRMPQLVMPVVERIAHAIEAQGSPEDAADFRAQVDARLKAHEAILEDGEGVAGRPGSHRGRLPEQCPTCYAPLRSDEVEWLEPDRAQCAYCGAVVLTE